MEWTDHGIVLGVRRHGEGNAILEVMTPAHGRHLGLVRGGAGARLRPLLQPGNEVRVTWRARLDEHLGAYTVEPLRLRAAGFLEAAHAIYGITHLGTLCRLLPERDPHPAVYHALELVLDRMQEPGAAAALVALFELQLLAELGFGLDLECCAATGVRSDLIYVSPKSGRAVSRSAGAPWQAQLLRLPAFFLDQHAPAEASADDVIDALTLTGFFLAHRVFEPRAMELPEVRTSFMAAVQRQPRPVARSA